MKKIVGFLFFFFNLPDEHATPERVNIHLLDLFYIDSYLPSNVPLIDILERFISIFNLSTQFQQKLSMPDTVLLFCLLCANFSRQKSSTNICIEFWHWNVQILWQIVKSSDNLYELWLDPLNNHSMFCTLQQKNSPTSRILKTIS